MRQVNVFKRKKYGHGDFRRVLDGVAKFHEFGCQYDEYDNGIGSYSVAIVEWDNGKVESIPVDDIEFID